MPPRSSWAGCWKTPRARNRHVEVAADEPLRELEDAGVRAVEDGVQLTGLEGHAVVGLTHRDDQHLAARCPVIVDGRADTAADPGARSDRSRGPGRSVVRGRERAEAGDERSCDEERHGRLRSGLRGPGRTKGGPRRSRPAGRRVRGRGGEVPLSPEAARDASVTDAMRTARASTRRPSASICRPSHVGRSNMVTAPEGQVTGDAVCAWRMFVPLPMEPSMDSTRSRGMSA